MSKSSKYLSLALALGIGPLPFMTGSAQTPGGLSEKTRAAESVSQLGEVMDEASRNVARKNRELEVMYPGEHQRIIQEGAGYFIWNAIRILRSEQLSNSAELKFGDMFRSPAGDDYKNSAALNLLAADLAIARLPAVSLMVRGSAEGNKPRSLKDSDTRAALVNDVEDALSFLNSTGFKVRVQKPKETQSNSFLAMVINVYNDVISKPLETPNPLPQSTEFKLPVAEAAPIESYVAQPQPSYAPLNAVAAGSATITASPESHASLTAPAIGSAVMQTQRQAAPVLGSNIPRLSPVIAERNQSQVLTVTPQGSAVVTPGQAAHTTGTLRVEQAGSAVIEVQQQPMRTAPHNAARTVSPVVASKTVAPDRRWLCLGPDINHLKSCTLISNSQVTPRP